MKIRLRWLMLAGLIMMAIAAWWYWPRFAGTTGAQAVLKPRQVPYLAPDRQPYAGVLRAIVQPDGLVAYHRLDDAIEKALANYLQEVANATPARFPSDNHRLAFFINAYNALVLSGVKKAMPIASVEDVGPLHAFFRERVYIVAGTKVSLHGLETKVIRKFDPMLHFGLNCASKSCPPLAAEPYRPEILQQQLEASARSFLNNCEHNRFNPQDGVLELSKIFEWYAGDFGGEAGVRKILAKFGPADLPNDAPIRYRPYDWSLNISDKTLEPE